MEKYKISIIVPIYKVELVLERCLDSLIEQTYQNLEIILVDDGSPDKCGQICENYSKFDSRITTIHKENGGLSDARNAGLKVATGDYVMFVDSDDYIEKNACLKFSSYFNDIPDIIIGDCVTENKGYSIQHSKTLQEGEVFSGKEYLLRALEEGEFPVVVWLNLYKRSFLNKNNLWFKKDRLHEDIEFTPRALYYATSVIYSNIKFYYYITNDNSISSAKDKSKHCKDIFSTCIELNDFIQNEECRKLKVLLNDFLCSCYLNIYRAGRMYRKGPEYIHRRYVIKKSYRMKNKIKALLFCVSPKWYCEYKK